MESANTRFLTIVGFTGKAGSGKDYMGSMLYRTHGFMPIAFADCMKETLSAREGIPMAELLGSKSERGRTRLQIYGTDEERAKDPDIWVKHLEARLWLLAEKLQHHRFAFTDIRFENEAALVRKYGGLLFWLRGRGSPAMTEEQDAHISENFDPIQVDHVVANSIDRSALAAEEVRRSTMEWLVSKASSE